MGDLNWVYEGRIVMTSYYERWKKYGEYWKNLFRIIDSVIYGFAKEYDAEVIPWHSDEPNRILSWEKNGIQRNIYLAFERKSFPQLVIKGNAWIDISEGCKTKRHYRRSEASSIEVPDWDVKTINEINESLKRRLSDVYESVSSFTQEDLVESLDISSLS